MAVTPQEALIYLMVVTSASDREMSDVELAKIGSAVSSLPVFAGFDESQLIDVAQDCQKLLEQDGGLEKVFTLARDLLPKRLYDTAYALAAEVAAADLFDTAEERRIRQLLANRLSLDELTVAAIDRTVRARHRSLA